MKTSFQHFCIVLILGVIPAFSQEPGYTFTTIAGQYGVGNVDGVGVAARFTDPIGIASDKSGNLYVVDTGTNTVRQITPGAVVTTLAGMPGVVGNADGAGASARFASPNGIAVGDDGVIYIADTGNNVIRKIGSDGIVRTLAGGHGGKSDGLGNASGFAFPTSLVVGSLGIIYVTDTSNHTIRRIDRDGLVTTLAGEPGVSGSNDGSGASAHFNRPSGITISVDGNLYVSDTFNNTIRKVTPTGVVTTLAGMAGTPGSTDGTAFQARFWAPYGLAADAVGNLYVADVVNGSIRRISLAGEVSTLARGLLGALGLTFDRTSGDLFVAEDGVHRIKKLALDGTVTFFAGSTLPLGSVDGIGTDALFSSPRDVAADSSGNIFVADSGGVAIRKIAWATSYVTTWAGSIGSSGSSDGVGTGASFASPWGLKLDDSGSLWVADFGLNAIRKIDPLGNVVTVAGAAYLTGSADGMGAAARFNGPMGIAIDGNGAVFVSDNHNNTIRRIDPSGLVTTPFGVSSIFSGSADGFGNDARFANPAGLVFDQAGNLYVADVNNHAIRKISPAGEVTTLAGSPQAYGGLDGLGRAATFHFPYGLAIDHQGNIFVADKGSHTIRKITPDGMVGTIGGLSGTAGFADGTGSAARFNGPAGIAVDRFGNIYVAESENNTIRKGVVFGAKPPSFTLQPKMVFVGAGVKATFSAAASGLPAPIYQWQRRAAGAVSFVDLTDTNVYSGTTTDTLTIASTTNGMNSDQFRCVANNGILPLASSQIATLVIVPPPTFTSPGTTEFAVGVPSSFAIVATGGVKNFKLESGTLPSWLSLNATTGILAGTAPDSAGGPFVFVIRASNEVAGTFATQSFTLKINPGPVVTTQPKPLSASAGSSAVFTVGSAGVAPLSYKWLKDGVVVADSNTISGAKTSTLAIDGLKSSDAGSYVAVVSGVNGTAVSDAAVLNVVAPPVISIQPASQEVALGARLNFTVTASSTTPLKFQWFFNGQTIPGATASIYAIASADAGWAGQYTVRVSDSTSSTVSVPAILTVPLTAKTAGFSSEVGADILHPGGGIYDQVLLTGNFASVTADAGQVARISYTDLSDDIVQVEFSGLGTLNLHLDASSGPSAPANYNQSAVSYMKGHATITISGADETTNVSVFSVGRANAINQSIFRDEIVYDGLADIGSITITSRNGKFGGVFTGNTSYFDTKGITGIYAPKVQFTGPVVIGNISGADSARAMLVLGSASDVRVAGGSLAQMNQQAVQVEGVTRLTFTAGANSHGVALPAKLNQARLLQNGVNVTDEIVVNPAR
jgi:sugar lactone lactonase YvrE